MEKEKVWVECINGEDSRKSLTTGKIYRLINTYKYSWQVIDDNGDSCCYDKDRFKIVKQYDVKTKDGLWVECIGNDLVSSELTIGKIYKVIKSNNTTYSIINDKGLEDWFGSHRFKPINKTSILKTIKWNGIDNIDMEVDDKYRIIVTCENNFIKFMLYDDTQLDLYTFKLINNHLAVDKLNDYISKFNLKIELEQPKYKINCDKLYTKEEAEKLKESGIDLVEVSE